MSPDRVVAQAGDPIFPTGLDRYLSIEPVQYTDDLYSTGIVTLGDVAIFVEGGNKLNGYVPHQIEPIWSLEINSGDAPLGRHLAIAENGLLALVGNGSMRFFKLDPAIPHKAPVDIRIWKSLSLPTNRDCKLNVINQPAIDIDGSVLVLATTDASSEGCSAATKYLLFLQITKPLTWVKELEGSTFSPPVFGPNGKFVYVVSGEVGLSAYNRQNPKLNATLALPTQTQLKADINNSLQAPVIHSSSQNLQSIFVVANTQNGGLLTVIENSALLKGDKEDVSQTPVLGKLWAGHDVGWCGQWGQLMFTGGAQDEITMMAAYKPIVDNSACTKGEVGKSGLVALKLPLKKTTDVPNVLLAGAQLAPMPNTAVLSHDKVVFGRNAQGTDFVAVEIQAGPQRVFEMPVLAQNKAILNLGATGAVYAVDTLGTTREVRLLSTGLDTGGNQISDTEISSANALVIANSNLPENAKIRAASAVRVRAGTVLGQGTTISVSATLP